MSLCILLNKGVFSDIYNGIITCIHSYVCVCVRTRVCGLQLCLSIEHAVDSRRWRQCPHLYFRRLYARYFAFSHKRKKLLHTQNYIRCNMYKVTQCLKTHSLIFSFRFCIKRMQNCPRWSEKFTFKKRTRSKSGGNMMFWSLSIKPMASST